MAAFGTNALNSPFGLVHCLSYNDGAHRLLLAHPTLMKLRDYAPLGSGRIQFIINQAFFIEIEMAHFIVHKLKK